MTSFQGGKETWSPEQPRPLIHQSVNPQTDMCHMTCIEVEAIRERVSNMCPLLRSASSSAANDSIGGGSSSNALPTCPSHLPGLSAVHPVVPKRGELFSLLQHAAETNEVFILASKVVANTLLRAYAELAKGGPAAAAGASEHTDPAVREAEALVSGGPLTLWGPLQEIVSLACCSLLNQVGQHICVFVCERQNSAPVCMSTNSNRDVWDHT